jgi:hypothetical protein
LYLVLLPSEIEAKLILPSIRCTRGDRRIILRIVSIQELMYMIDDIAANLAKIGSFIRSSLIICEVHHCIESNIDKMICEECEANLLKEHSVR